MDRIMMTSRPMMVTAIKKKTQAEMLKDVERGDVLQFSIPLKSAGRGRGTYASDVRIDNVTKGTHTYKTLTIASATVYNSFELMEVND